MTAHLSEFTVPRRFNVVLPPRGRLGAWLFTSNVLVEAERFAATVPGAVVEDWSGQVAERACRACGCTQNRACSPPCWWVEADLCSTCRYAGDESG